MDDPKDIKQEPEAGIHDVKDRDDENDDALELRFAGIDAGENTQNDEQGGDNDIPNQPTEFSTLKHDFSSFAQIIHSRAHY
jgi:hypothetical protein